MTLFTINHPDGTKSTHESNTDASVLWAIVVFTPADTRNLIRSTQRLISETALGNIHRAVADGTVTERDGVTYVGGLTASSPESLLAQWDDWLEGYNNLTTDLPDLYQTTHWFTSMLDGIDAFERLQDEYDATPWDRSVILKPVAV